MYNTHSHPSSPQSTSTTAQTTSCLRTSASPVLPTPSKRYSEPATTRQSRLLQNRNAKFPAKKLSLSNLGSRFSQLIHANDEVEITNTCKRKQENEPLNAAAKSVSNKTFGSIASFDLLDEDTNYIRPRKLKRGGDIPIYQDTPERPLLERSPFSSPAIYQATSSQVNSPIGFDHIQDSIVDMRLREISGNEHRSSPLTSSPLNGSIKAIKKRKSMPLKSGFDSQEYIEHIEKQLQEAKNEMFSPTTNKSLKDQLKTVRGENEKLKQDLVDMREMFEAEVKRAVEYKVEMEAELKRKVRDLEEELELKTSAIKDLELQHDEKRLDSNAIDTLKASIEKLEQEKLSLRDENRSVSKRNEVLSELLAMSPTKLQTFELRSPVREKRGAGRPMSMIIPRLPSSPNSRQISQPASAIVSPSLSACGPVYSPLKSDATSPQISGYGLGIDHAETADTKKCSSELTEQDYFGTRDCGGDRSRRSTLQSQASTSDAISMVSNASSPPGHVPQRILPKRKPRKFMSGSTQLKPLLLSALNGDCLPTSSSSAASSPQIEASRDFSQESIDPTTYFLSRSTDSLSQDDQAQIDDSPRESLTEQSNGSSEATFRNLEDIMAEHDTSSSIDTSADPFSNMLQSRLLSTGSSTLDIEDDVYAVDDASTNESLKGISLGHRPSASVQTPFYQASNPKNISQPLGFNLDALRRLELPEPEYDALPEAHRGINETLFTDIPRPLFSVHAHNKQMSPTDRAESISTSPQHRRTNTNLFQAHNMRFIDAVNNDMQLSPCPRTRSSWHSSSSQRSWQISPSICVPKSVTSDRSELPQRSTLRPTHHPTRTNSPMAILRSGPFGPQPLASVTIRTILGVISRYASHVQDFKRDPLALARRVITNAWLSNWSRFGKLSWWVLGLFKSARLGRSVPKESKGWHDYDGEEIAQRVHDEADFRQTDCRSSGQPASAQNQIQNSHAESLTGNTANARAKVGWGQSMLLWGKFSVAIMMAVGGAVVKGPGEMLKEIDDTGNDVDIATKSQCPTQQSDNGRFGSDITDLHHSTNRAQRPVSFTQHHHHSTRPWSHGASHSFSSDSSRPQTAVYSGHSNSLHSQSMYAGEIEEDTLRAARVPPMHVSDVFRRTENHASKYNSNTFTPSSNHEDRAANPLTDYFDSAALKWPPSPGPILPSTRSTFRRNHF